MRCKPLLNFILPAVLMLAGGCLDARTVVLVRRDGSGTVTETVLLDEVVAARVALEGAGISNLVELCTARAGTFGRGVRLNGSSVRELRQNGMVGYEAAYSFDNVRTLSVAQTPELSCLGRFAPRRTGEAQPVTFDFEGSGYPTLTILVPQSPVQKAPEPDAGADRKPRSTVTREEMAVLRKLLAHLRIVLQVKVDGEIARTTAAFAAGPEEERNTITLIDIDAARLLSDDDRLRKVVDIGRVEDVETARARLAGIAGVLSEPRDRVTVRFW